MPVTIVTQVADDRGDIVYDSTMRRQSSEIGAVMADSYEDGSQTGIDQEDDFPCRSKFAMTIYLPSHPCDDAVVPSRTNTTRRQCHNIDGVSTDPREILPHQRSVS